MDALEQMHGNDVSENGELGVAEEWAVNKAFYTDLLGFPLILWDRRILLKPSPYKRVILSCKLFILIWKHLSYTHHILHRYSPWWHNPVSSGVIVLQFTQ